MSNCVWLSSAEGTAAPQRGPRRPPPPGALTPGLGFCPARGAPAWGAPSELRVWGGRWASGQLGGFLDPGLGGGGPPLRRARRWPS